MAKGGSGPDTPNVAPASLTDIANEAINANIGNLPKLLAAFQQYGPQYANAINDIFGQSQKRLQELFPEQYGVQKAFSSNLTNALGAIGQAGGTGIPSTLLAPMQDYMRGSQGARGMANSPISALTEAQAYGGLAEQYRQGISDEALRFLNTSPLVTPGGQQSLETLGLSPISNTNLFQGGITQDAARVNNSYNQFALEQERFNAQQRRRSSIGSMFGAAGGGALGFMVGGPAGAYMGASAGSAAGGTFF